MACIVTAVPLLAAANAETAAPTLRWKIVAEYPHDATGFTQGLLWHEGRLFESDGQYGASKVTEKNLATGETLRVSPLPASEFGEGLALHAGALWQLTWREGVLHRYDLDLKPTGDSRARDRLASVQRSRDLMASAVANDKRDLAIAREMRALQPDLQIDWFTVPPAAQRPRPLALPSTRTDCSAPAISARPPAAFRFTWRNWAFTWLAVTP